MSDDYSELAKKIEFHPKNIPELKRFIPSNPIETKFGLIFVGKTDYSIFFSQRTLASSSKSPVISSFLGIKM